VDGHPFAFERELTEIVFRDPGLHGRGTNWDLEMIVDPTPRRTATRGYLPELGFWCIIVFPALVQFARSDWLYPAPGSVLLPRLSVPGLMKRGRSVNRLKASS